MHLAAEGGHLDVIQFLSPRFGAKVHDRTDDGYTMLHWAAQKGHSQAACYLVQELKMNPKDRDKVCGVPEEDVFHSARSPCMIHVCICVTLCSESRDKEVSPGHVYVQ